MFMPNPGILAAGAGGPSAGQQLFTSPGTFIVPSGAVNLCGVAIGKGSDGVIFDDGGVETFQTGYGGALRYRNAIPDLVDGEALTVTFDEFSVSLIRGATILLRAMNGLYDAGSGVGTGFAGGPGAQFTNPALLRRGGGAGGYTSAGVGSGSVSSDKGGGGTSLLGGGAGAAAGASSTSTGLPYGGGGGGYFGTGGPGGLRLMWGLGRAFPNTNTGDL